MEQNIERLTGYYKTGCIESERVCRDRANRLEEIVTLHYLNMLIPENSKILDACAGAGIYAFPLAEAGYHVTSGDVVSHHVDFIRQKQKVSYSLDEVYHGDICDLSRFADESFDAVLNLGAYYHMTDGKQRNKALSECKRVLKPGGLLFVAYLNKYSNFIKYCDDWNDKRKDIDLYLDRGFMEDDSLFYATVPEDVETEISSLGFEIVKNVATDGIKFAFRRQLNELDDDIYEKFLNHHFEMCETRTLLGYSEHALIIGRKL